MALLTAASMIMTAFTPVYAESTDTARQQLTGKTVKILKQLRRRCDTVATGTMYHLNTETTIL